MAILLLTFFLLTNKRTPTGIVKLLTTQLQTQQYLNNRCKRSNILTQNLRIPWLVLHGCSGSLLSQQSSNLVASVRSFRFQLIGAQQLNAVADTNALSIITPAPLLSYFSNPVKPPQIWQVQTQVVLVAQTLLDWLAI